MTSHGSRVPRRSYLPVARRVATHVRWGRSRASGRVKAVLVTGLVALGTSLTAVGAAGPALGATGNSPGPPTLATGFMDYNLDADEPALFTRAARAGAQWVRLSADWRDIAPTQPPSEGVASDPAWSSYNLQNLDQTLRLAAAAHLRVLLNIDMAPNWAEAPGAPSGTEPGSWRPDVADLGAFAHALAERYSGHFPDPLYGGHFLPGVSDFQIWNEPNLSYYLSPQWVRSSTGRYVATSPSIYRSMLNTAYAAIKSVQPRATVLSAGTAPYGDPPGGQRMQPLSFMQALFCLAGPSLKPYSCPAVHLDGLDHHPYSTYPTQRAAVPGDASVANMSQLERIAAVAERDRHVLPAGPKPYWVTEISWSSIPPEYHGAAFPATLAAQARYLSLAFYELWRQGISHVLWYLVQDDPQIVGFSGSGVYFQNGVAKPSQAAFRFPFVAVGIGHGVVRVWGRAPQGGSVSIQRQIGGRWRQISTTRVRTTGSVFLQNLELPTSARLRAVCGGVISLPYSPS